MIPNCVRNTNKFQDSLFTSLNPIDREALTYTLSLLKWFLEKKKFWSIFVHSDLWMQKFSFQCFEITTKVFKFLQLSGECYVNISHPSWSANEGPGLSSLSCTTKGPTTCSHLPITSPGTSTIRWMWLAFYLLVWQPLFSLSKKLLVLFSKVVKAENKKKREWALSVGYQKWNNFI